MNVNKKKCLKEKTVKKVLGKIKNIERERTHNIVRWEGGEYVRNGKYLKPHYVTKHCRIIINLTGWSISGIETISSS